MHSESCSGSDVFSTHWSTMGKPCPAPRAEQEDVLFTMQSSPQTPQPPQQHRTRGTSQKHTACSYLQSAPQNISPQLLKKKGQRKRKCRAAAVPYSKQLLRTVTSMHEMRPTFGHASGSNNTRYILQLKLMKIHAPLSCRRDYWWSFG